MSSDHIEIPKLRREDDISYGLRKRLYDTVCTFGDLSEEGIKKKKRKVAKDIIKGLRWKTITNIPLEQWESELEGFPFLASIIYQQVEDTKELQGN